MTGWPVADPARPPMPAQAPELAGRARAAIADDHDVLHVGRACELARVRTLARPLRVGSSRHMAMLVPETNGFRAIVDSSAWSWARSQEQARRRLRFVLSHELGHTLFYEDGSPPRRTRPTDQREESFCNRFAMSLLVPHAAAKAAAADPSGLSALASRYDVSLRLAAWAAAEAQPGLTVLMLRRAPHPHRGGEEAMRTVWGASRRFIAPGESFKSSLAELAPGERARSSERLRLSGLVRDYDIDAWRFPSWMLVALWDRSAVTPPAADAGVDERQLPLFA